MLGAVRRGWRVCGSAAGRALGVVLCTLVVGLWLTGCGPGLDASPRGPAAQALAPCAKALAIDAQARARESDLPVDPGFLSAPGDRLALALPDGSRVEATRLRPVEALAGGGVAWFGRTGEGWTVVAVIRDGRLSGALHTSRGAYRLTTGDGRLRISEVVPTGLPWDPAARVAPPGRPGPAPGTKAVAGPGGGAQLDLIVEYTESALRLCPTAELDLHAAVAEANQASLDSDAPIQLRVVDAVCPSSIAASARFQETGSTERDLELFRGRTDSTLNEIHTRRNTAGADVAVLVVAERDPLLGDAAAIGATEDAAFAVVDCRFLVGIPVLAHEVGHLLGLRHHDDPTASSYPAGHGYVHAPDGKAPWATIMAAPCRGCLRLFQWSNPRRSYPYDGTGVPTGIQGTNDAVSVLQDTAPIAAGFRPARDGTGEDVPGAREGISSPSAWCSP